MITVCPDCLKLECRCAANAKTRATLRRRGKTRRGEEYIPPELRKETRVCPACRGAGLVQRRDEHMRFHLLECARCRGSGRVTVADQERKQR